MKFRRSKISTSRILLSTLFLLGSFYVLVFGRKSIKTRYYDKQIAAAQKMSFCISSLNTTKLIQGDFSQDTIRTNIIGVEYSEITTTLGDLSAKRISTNPDFAALLVRWFSRLKLNPGDVVAVGCSGSFPALIIATICAAESMDLQPVIISSLGASSYGANRPEFTWLDMENYLFRNRLIQSKSVAASIGGAGDRGEGLTENGKMILRGAISRSGARLIDVEGLKENIKARSQIYEQFGMPKVFVNIGGASVNVGDYHFSNKLKLGINQRKIPVASAPSSMSGFYLGSGIPVIHLLHVKQIVLENRLDFNNFLQFEPGKSAVYFDGFIPKRIWLLSILFLAAGLTVLLRGSKFS